MNILLINNLIFIKMSTNNSFCPNAKDKYIAGTVSGVIFPNEVYTLAEIKQTHGLNIREVKDFFELVKVYNQ